jgi:glycosyltransferase involved in cell wall biosynthesis
MHKTYLPKFEKLPLSISIISFNEEDIVQKMLESVKDIASEIILVDSNSLDRTRDIAKEYNTKVFIEEWKGHIAQKNSALQKCSQDWILCLDCDEVLSDELKYSIVNSINKPECKAFFVNRKTYYIGKFMNYAWRPDWKLRLIHKSLNPKWSGLDPHDYIEINKKENSNKLHGDLIHYSYSGIKEHFAKTIDYARISADSYYKVGRKSNVINLLFNPLFAFFRLYFLNLGILDGVRGFIAGISSFIGTFLKYAFLFELQIKNKHNKN